MFEDTEASWSRQLEHDYMTSHNREYRKTTVPVRQRTKGCYECIIAEAKTTQVKLVNRADRATIRMRKPRTMMERDRLLATPDQKQERQQKGSFYLWNWEAVSCGFSRREGF